MKKTLPAAVLTLTAIASTAALAAAPSDLSFRELEYQQPRNPLLPSNQSADIVQHTPQAWLSNATAALNGAIPAGTSRTDAEAILHKAGATCRTTGTASENCAYFDVKTRDPYVDAVRWNVALHLAGDQVSGLSVDRSWTRSQ